MDAKWHTQLRRFSVDHLGSIANVVRAIIKTKCTIRIDVGNKNGAIFIVCGDDIGKAQRCRDCMRPWIVKTSLSILDPGKPNARVLPHEAYVMHQITVAMNELGPRYEIYKTCVLQFVEHAVDTNQETLIVYKFVPYIDANVQNLRAYAMSGLMKPKDIAIIVIQVFLTLQFIRLRVPGFVHMDLLLQQIFLCAWPNNGPVVMPINSTKAFVLPKRVTWPVIGDFGTSITSQFPQAKIDYGFYKQGVDFCNITQDVFRFFYDLYALIHGPSKDYVLEICQQVFQGRFLDYAQRAAQFNFAMYLPLGIDLFDTYSSVLERIPDCVRYIKEA